MLYCGGARGRGMGVRVGAFGDLLERAANALGLAVARRNVAEVPGFGHVWCRGSFGKGGEGKGEGLAREAGRGKQGGEGKAQSQRPGSSLHPCAPCPGCDVPNQAACPGCDVPNQAPCPGCDVPNQAPCPRIANICVSAAVSAPTQTPHQ
eukprot:351839-Chlamydomonas_euryale.AAC.2